MKVENWNEIVAKLEMEISNIKDPNGIHTPIQDGIVSLEDYINSKVKVMWVLKEANSSDDSDWDQRSAIKFLRTENGIIKGWKRTFEHIIYVTNGIINGKKWDEMPDIEDEYSIIDVLKELAYINVKKIPGGGTSKEGEITSFFNNHKELLIEQINSLQPEVIIFGNTMKYFTNELKLKTNSYDSVDYAIYNNKLLIDAYHPNYVSRGGIKGEKYFNDITKVYKKYLNQDLEF